jgi:hypothetical protein
MYILYRLLEAERATDDDDDGNYSSSSSSNAERNMYKTCITVLKIKSTLR